MTLNTVAQGIALTQSLNGVEILGTLSACKDGSEVIKGELNGKTVVAFSADLGNILTDVTSLGGFTVSALGQNAIRLGGIIGATVVLVCDTKQLYDRLASLKEITDKLKKAPVDSLEYKILKAEQIHMVKLIASSSSAVSVDTLEVGLSAGLPMPSLPVNAVAFAVSMGRIAFEKQTIESLKESLIKITKEWAGKNARLIKNKQSFIDKHKHLELRYNQAKAEKDKTAAALEHASSAMRSLPHKGTIELHKQAQQMDVEAEKTLKEIEIPFQQSSQTLTDLAAYEKASKQIVELDPLLSKETMLVKKIETLEALSPDISIKSLPNKKEELSRILKESQRDLLNYRLTQSPIPVLVLDDRTDFMNEGINSVKSKMKELNEYDKNHKELAKVKARQEKNRHHKLSKTPLSPDHFVTSQDFLDKPGQPTVSVFHGYVPTVTHSLSQSEFETQKPLVGPRGITLIHIPSNPSILGSSMPHLEKSTSLSALK